MSTETTLVLSREEVSRLKIIDGIEGLLLYSNFDDVNVAQICSVCSISKPTFYHYFSNRQSIATWLIGFIVEQSLRTSSSLGTKEFWSQFFTQCSSFKTILKSVSNSKSSSFYVAHLENTLHKTFLDQCKELPHSPSSTFEVASIGFSGAISHCIWNWIKRDMDKDVDTMVLYVSKVLPSVLLARD